MQKSLGIIPFLWLKTMWNHHVDVANGRFHAYYVPTSRWQNPLHLIARIIGSPSQTSLDYTPTSIIHRHPILYHPHLSTSRSPSHGCSVFFWISLLTGPTPVFTPAAAIKASRAFVSLAGMEAEFEKYVGHWDYHGSMAGYGRHSCNCACGLD